jgi:hypothetical protein
MLGEALDLRVGLEMIGKTTLPIMAIDTPWVIGEEAMKAGGAPPIIPLAALGPTLAQLLAPTYYA